MIGTLLPTWGSHWLTSSYNLYGKGKDVCVLTLVSVRTPAHAMKPGDIKDDGAGNWLLACPRCGLVAYLDHQVQMLLDQISISPSIECPNTECGYHEVVSGWELRKGYKI